MKKRLTEKVVYEPNERVKITVDNKPVHDDAGALLGYDRKVTIAVKAGVADTKLSFADAAEVDNFINDIDVEDPQQSLLS